MKENKTITDETVSETSNSELKKKDEYRVYHVFYTSAPINPS